MQRPGQLDPLHTHEQPICQVAAMHALPYAADMWLQLLHGPYSVPSAVLSLQSILIRYAAGLLG